MATKVLGLVQWKIEISIPETKIFNLPFTQITLSCSHPASRWLFLFCLVPSLSKRLLKKIQISQNKCIRYCLKLDNKSHVGVVEFKKLNWLLTKERVYQCICISIFKFFIDMSPEYTSEVFCPSYRRHNTRASTLMLDVPFRKYCSDQNTLSYLRLRTWNTLPAQIILRRSVNTFKHDIKKSFFDILQKDTDDLFIYY